MIDLAELIAKLEAATGPSRGLDDAIWALAYKGYKVRWKEDEARPEFCVPDCWCFSGHSRPGDHWGATEPWAGGPYYTKSLDDAMTVLVRRASNWRLETAPVGYDFETWGPEGVFYGHGATSALAVCIAALKARVTA